MPDVTLKGTVTQIAPAGTQSSGVVNYPVTVTLDKARDAVKTGMTANLTIVVDERKNVLTVPNQAIKTVNKQKVVDVLKNGQQVQTPVQDRPEQRQPDRDHRAAFRKAMWWW